MAKKISALAILEEARIDFLVKAKSVAIRLAKQNGTVNSDQLRAHCDLPENINPSVFGCVFSRKNEWKIISFVKSTRAESHGRYIKQFEYIGNKA